MPAVDISMGTLPNWNKQLNSPELFNLFVGSSGQLYPTPVLRQLAALTNCFAMWYSNYDGGVYIVCTDTALFRILSSGAVTLLTTIASPANAVVEITENFSNQLTITNGIQAVVYDQVTATTTILGATQGFDINNPISCTTLNGFTVIIGADNRWNISGVNNALVYDAASTQKIDPSLVRALAVKTLDNNLFIFGTAGIERWEPTLNVNQYLFPLQKDMGFKNNFGAIATNAIYSDINNIYFLSSRFAPMALSAREGVRELQSKGQPVDGIANIFADYNNVRNVRTAIFTYRSNYFFQLNFEDEEINWVYCVNSQTWCNTDDFIIDSYSIGEAVLKSDGIYILDTPSNYPVFKRRRWVSPKNNAYKGQVPSRGLLNGVEVQIAQGQSVASQSSTPEVMYLSISPDNVSWSNQVTRNIGQTGQTQYKTRWQTNFTASFFALKLEYFGTLDLTIEGVDAIIN